MVTYTLIPTQYTMQRRRGRKYQNRGKKGFLSEVDIRIITKQRIGSDVYSSSRQYNVQSVERCLSENKYEGKYTAFTSKDR